MGLPVCSHSCIEDQTIHGVQELPPLATGVLQQIIMIETKNGAIVHRQVNVI